MLVNNEKKFLDKIFVPFNPNLRICILGNTTDDDKVAYQIKQALFNKGYLHIYGVDKEFPDLKCINEQLDLLVLCMHPSKSIQLLMNDNHYFKCAIIQPGAESDEIISWFKTKKIKYTLGCLLKYFNLK